MKSRKSKISLSLSFAAAFVVILGLSASPKKAWSIEPNECITPWGKDWHNALHLKNSEYLACHSCYDMIVDPATGEGATNIPRNKSHVVSNVGLACGPDNPETPVNDGVEHCNKYRLNANKIEVTWALDISDALVDACRDSQNFFDINTQCLRDALTNEQKVFFTFEGADILNPHVQNLTPFYEGSDSCFPTCPDGMPNSGLPTDTCEIYDLFFGEGSCPTELAGFNPQNAPYVSFTAALPPAQSFATEGLHKWRVFFAMNPNGVEILSQFPIVIPDLKPNITQESITDATWTNYVNPNQ